MKADANLCNSLKLIRQRLGLSQQDLAAVAGVSRQTISGVESGQYAPSTTVALRLAKALGCPVESLFWLEQERTEMTAIPAQNMPVGQRLRVSLVSVDRRWVAHPLIGPDAFRLEMIPADGEGIRAPKSATMAVQGFNQPQRWQQTLAIAGCSPALSIWARTAEHWHPDLRIHCLSKNSTEGLQQLCRREIHIAGMHLYDPETKAHNVSFVTAALQQMTPDSGMKRAVVLINLGIWEEGLLFRSDNPFNLKTVADLAQPEITIVNREVGAGSRQVLERALQGENIPFGAIQGFDQMVTGHLEVAVAVASGKVAAGVSTASVAAAFGLGFIPLHQARYDLVVFKTDLEETAVQQLLSTLGHQSVRSQLQGLGGYDTRQTGEAIATVEFP
jgi:molybdate-binding protein/DNA-binding XRE family transcriptional regulator